MKIVVIWLCLWVIVGNELAPALASNATASSSGTVLRRGKRYLDFTKGTRISWRTTVKNNILKVNTLWAYGFGFRANFPFPDKADRLRPFFKRDVFHALENVIDGHGLDGRGCLLKSFCTTIMDLESNHRHGMLFKLLKVVFSEPSAHCPNETLAMAHCCAFKM